MRFSEVLTRAETYVGITENPPFSNRVVISDWCDKAWWLGFSRQGSQWCGTFVDLCLGPDLSHGISVFSVAFGVQHYKRAGLWSDLPRPGYVCFMSFTPDRFPGHVGLVKAVINNQTVDNLEGNTSAGYRGSQSNGGGVYQRTRTGSAILGYGIVEYEPELTTQLEETPDVLPYYMLKSVKYQNIFAVFGGDQGRIVVALLGPGEFNALLARGVPYNGDVNDDEITRAHAASGSTIPLIPTP